MGLGHGCQIQEAMTVLGMWSCGEALFSQGIFGRIFSLFGPFDRCLIILETLSLIF